MSRLQYVLKTYEKQQVVVEDTVAVAFNMLGIHDIRLGDTALRAMARAEYAQELARPFEYDFLFPWIAREFSRYWKQVLAGTLSEHVYYDYVHQTTLRGTAIAQWALANRVDLTKTNLYTALRESRDWVVPVKIVPGEIIYTLPDGWTVQLLTTPAQLKSEGEVMQQCVGEYCERVEEGEAVIYSLRDVRGRPHVTMEFDPHAKRFLQVYGKQNEEPIEEYAARARMFIRDRFKAEIHGMILAGADPRTLNLRGTNLNGAYLSQLDLRGIDLSGASLIGANLFNVDLEEADLRQADLRRASLDRANLRYANLSGADLRDADLERADLRGANLTNIMEDDDTRWPSESYF
jgi:hypothetical protein